MIRNTTQYNGTNFQNNYAPESSRTNTGSNRMRGSQGKRPFNTRKHASDQQVTFAVNGFKKVRKNI